MRDGRYCIPIKNEHRTQVAGIIHDQSKTGSTVYIEPAAVVKLNNEIRELKIRETQEIEVVLANLSSMLSEKTGLIRQDYDLMSELDFIFARARLALEQNAVRPTIGNDGILDIRKARHPLIPPKKAVPIDIRLGDTFNLLVVTGPNTGGKTVSLKTTGLLTMMGLAGLHIPAGSQSRLSVFTEIYADIGDEQSIEQSLSTFSSHMKNVAKAPLSPSPYWISSTAATYARWRLPITARSRSTRFGLPVWKMHAVNSMSKLSPPPTGF